VCPIHSMHKGQVVRTRLQDKHAGNIRRKVAVRKHGALEGEGTNEDRAHHHLANGGRNDKETDLGCAGGA
jgi:hypothetical protein